MANRNPTLDDGTNDNRDASLEKDENFYLWDYGVTWGKSRNTHLTRRIL